MSDPEQNEMTKALGPVMGHRVAESFSFVLPGEQVPIPVVDRHGQEYKKSRGQTIPTMIPYALTLRYERFSAPAVNADWALQQVHIAGHHGSLPATAGRVLFLDELKETHPDLARAIAQHYLAFRKEKES